jgi:hypothetical protein
MRVMFKSKTPRAKGISIPPDHAAGSTHARGREARQMISGHLPNFGHESSEILLRSSRLFGRKQGLGISISVQALKENTK